MLKFIMKLANVLSTVDKEKDELIPSPDWALNTRIPKGGTKLISRFTEAYEFDPWAHSYIFELDGLGIRLSELEQEKIAVWAKISFERRGWNVHVSYHPVDFNTYKHGEPRRFTIQLERKGWVFVRGLGYEHLPSNRNQSC